MASGALSAGTKRRRIPAARAARAMGSIPTTGRRVPERESSPTKAQWGSDQSSCPAAVRMPTKMGRSYTVPDFRRLAGARFTVIRPTGKA